jgi:hypothetical protein
MEKDKSKIKELFASLKKASDEFFEKEKSTSKKKFAMDWKLKDGTAIQTTDPVNGDDGKLDVGDAVMITGADGSATPAPDGDLVLEDGTKISVAGGLIVNVEAPSSEEGGKAGDAQMSADFKAEYEKTIKILSDRLTAIESKLSDANKTIEAHKQEMAKAKEIHKSTFTLVEALADLPAEKPVEKKPTIILNDEDKRMSAFSKTLEDLKKK